MFRAARGPLSCAAFALLACCSPYSAPALEIADVGITEQSSDGFVVSFRVLAENRNAEPLPLRTVRYSVSINGRSSFSGERDAEATVRRFGAQEFILPVAFRLGEEGDLSEIPTSGVPYTISGSVEYETPGTIAEALFDSGIRRPTVSFSESGTLDFSQAGPVR